MGAVILYTVQTKSFIELIQQIKLDSIVRSDLWIKLNLNWYNNLYQ